MLGTWPSSERMRACFRPVIKAGFSRFCGFFGGARGTQAWRCLGHVAEAEAAPREDDGDLAAALGGGHGGRVGEVRALAVMGSCHTPLADEFEITVGPSANGSVNWTTAVYERVREFGALHLGAGAERVPSLPRRGGHGAKQRVGVSFTFGHNPLVPTGYEKAPAALAPGLPVNWIGGVVRRFQSSSPKATLVGTFACPVPSVKRSVRALADQARRVVRRPLADRHRAEDHDPADAGPAGQIFFLTTAATSR
jgi:hypothetical protein